MSTLLRMLALALLAWPPALEATTVLTNGIPIQVFKVSTENRTIFNGSEGFSILVPAGATSALIEFRTEPNAPLELMARQDLDIGIAPGGRPSTGNFAADYRDSPDNFGIARIEISDRTFPALRGGTLFIGFVSRADGTIEVPGELLVTLGGGPIETLFSVVESDFDDGDDGWTRNETAFGVEGSTAGHPDATIRLIEEGGNPGGYLAIRSIYLGPSEFFVAPDDFLTDLTALPEGRLAFDIRRFTGSSFTSHQVEVRVFNDEGGWVWHGPPAPPIVECPGPDEVIDPTLRPADCRDFFEGRIEEVWRTFSVPFRKDVWNRFGAVRDGARFEQVFSDPRRIEIRASFVSTGGTSGLDNVQLQARGQAPPQPVLPTISSFSAGMDRWTRNYPEVGSPAGTRTGDADSRLLWVEPLSDRISAFDAEGNPTGHLLLAEPPEFGGPGPDAFVAPQEFLGIYTDSMGPRFEFDFRHKSFAEPGPVTIRLFGAGSVFEWTGAVPIEQWGHQIARVTALAWPRVSGDATFVEALENVERIEIGADLAEGVEWNSLDNFALLTDDAPLPLQQIFAGPDDLSFSGSATDPIEETVELSVFATGGEVRWTAAIEGDIADSIVLSRTEGDTPDELTVSIDTSGLAPGEHSFQILISAQGTTLDPSVVNGVVILSAQPFPTPFISDGGVVQSATYWPRLAPGSLGTIFGGAFATPEDGARASFEGQRGDALPTRLANVRVLVYSHNTLIAEAPIIYGDDNQINFQMPFEVEGLSEVRIVVVNGNVRSEPQSVQIIPHAPGIFVFDADRAVAVNSDGTLNSSENPESRTRAMTLYMTGQGRVLPDWDTGRAATASPLLLTPAEVKVLVGRQEAHITFVGLAPGLVGVLQVNFVTSFFTPSGDQEIVVVIGGHTSNRAVVTIR